jgi:hypothetical protein
LLRARGRSGAAGRDGPPAGLRRQPGDDQRASGPAAVGGAQDPHDSAALRRALHSRDRGCRFPGCDQRRFVDAHHVRHWAHGGHTKLSNLLLLCRHHHRLIHEGGYRIEQASGGRAVFRRPDGGAIPAVPRKQPGSARRLVRENLDAGLRITDETPVARSAGERLCYDIEIEGLLWSEGLLRLGWTGSTPDELPRGSAEPEAAQAKVLT